MRKTGAIGGLLLLVASALLGGSCECEGGPRRTLDSVPEAPYPVEGDGEVRVERVLRSGPDMREQNVVERFAIREADGHTIVRVRQEWPLGVADLDVVFDEAGLPLRVAKRTLMPAAGGPFGHRDLRVYDLTASEDAVLMAHLGPDGSREGVAIRGDRPRAVIGPGRGVLTAWLQRAELEVGERLRESVLDVREPLAVIRDVTLKREADREVEGVGRVRVYTIYGREPIFADDGDVVIGDLFGLRPADAVEGPLPDPLPDPPAFDPRESP